MTLISLKNIVIILNILLVLLFFGYFLGHGIPQNLILWMSAIIWITTPAVNLLYIYRKDSDKE